MKVIGLIPEKYSGNVYICQVEHKELEKYMGLYCKGDKLKELKVGDEVDLCKGYDFFNDTKNALEKTQQFIEVNKKVLESIINGIKIMGK